MSPPYAFGHARTAVSAADYEDPGRETAREVAEPSYAREEEADALENEIHREVLGYTPRRGDESSTFWATVRYGGDASPKITQLKLGFGSFIVPDTKCTSSQSSDDPFASRMMLTCRVPAFDWIGWFMRKVPVYVLVINEDYKEKHDTTADVETGKKRKQENEFVVVDSWFIGEFIYNSDDQIAPANSRFVKPKIPITIPISSNPGTGAQLPQLHNQQRLFTPSKQPNPPLHFFEAILHGDTSRDSPIIAPSQQPPEKFPDLTDDVAFTEDAADLNSITASCTTSNMLTFTSTPISDPGNRSSHIENRNFAYGTQLLYGHDVPPSRSIGFSPPQTPGAQCTSAVKKPEPHSRASSCSFSYSSSISCCSFPRKEDYQLRDPSLTNTVGCAGLITPRVSPVNPYCISNPMASAVVAQRGLKKERQRGHTTNAESFLGTRAILKWESNVSLDDMVRNWSEDEKIIRRRLVQFTRRQEQNVVHCGYGQFNPDSVRSEHTFVVSCIHWPEPLTANRPDYYRSCASGSSSALDSRISPLPSPTSLSPSPVYGSRQNGYQPHDGPTHFITSVDLIHLLEFLLDSNFSVDEKNRIRRNLEVFKPLTVSKRKAETRDLFCAIMAFPSPKPRNIEKGLKIYDWFDVKNSLEKITSRYSATYSLVPDLNSQKRGDGDSVMTHDNQLQELQSLTQTPSLHLADHRMPFFTPTSASNSPMYEYRSESLPDVRHLHFRKHFGEDEGSASSSSVSSSCGLKSSSHSAATLTTPCLPRISSDPVFDGFGSEQIVVRPKPQRPMITASFPTHSEN